MAGLGSAAIHGAGLRITMDAGLCMEEIGVGGPARFTVAITPCGLRPMFHSLASEAAAGALWVSELVLGVSEAWVGCLAARVIASSHGMAEELIA